MICHVCKGNICYEGQEKGEGAKPTWESTCKGSLGLCSFRMKGLSSAEFSIAQPMLNRRVPEAKQASAAAANFFSNYQQSNKDHFLKNAF